MTFVATILDIRHAGDGELRVRFLVTPMGDEGPSGEGRTYEMLLDGNGMAPLDDLEACFEVYHEYDYDEGLNPRLRRQWKTANLGDQIAAWLITGGVAEGLRRVWLSEEAQ